MLLTLQCRARSDYATKFWLADTAESDIGTKQPAVYKCHRLVRNRDRRRNVRVIERVVERIAEEDEGAAVMMPRPNATSEAKSVDPRYR